MNNSNRLGKKLNLISNTLILRFLQLSLLVAALSGSNSFAGTNSVVFYGNLSTVRDSIYGEVTFVAGNDSFFCTHTDFNTTGNYSQRFIDTKTVKFEPKIHRLDNYAQYHDNNHVSYKLSMDFTPPFGVCEWKYQSARVVTMMYGMSYTYDVSINLDIADSSSTSPIEATCPTVNQGFDCSVDRITIPAGGVQKLDISSPGF